MVIGRDARTRLASVSFVALFGLLVAGCGDDTPAQPHDGGTGGSGGHGGDAGMDKNDADTKVDMGEAGDLAGDRGETGDLIATDRGDTGETGDVPADRNETGDTMGDTPGDTAEVARACYMVSFDQPKDQTTLSAADDKNADNCANGFQYDVKISSADAPDGTDVNLLANNTMLATTKVMGGKATFAGVQLASSGDTSLSIQFPSTMPCSAASTKAKVTVNCQVPACAISKPTHTTLNGIPVAQGGDRVSSPGSDYQVEFDVTTDIDDGRPVALKIDNTTSPATVTTVMGTAMGGKAIFGGVTLKPDGKYEVVAQCTDKNNVVGSSAKATFTVDSTPPDLTISTPQNGATFAPGALTNGAFKVCGQTTATDAVALPPSLGTLATNFCIAGTTNCAAVSAVSTDACVNFACPGGAPFNINVNLNDAVGNVTTKTISGVACASTSPTVLITAPISDAPNFADVSKRLLNAGASKMNNQLVDLDAGTAGAQATITACTDRAGMAQLMVGQAGGALAPLGAPVAATATSGCPAGLGFVATFTNVTLPESAESATGALSTATRLRVDLTDVATATGQSNLVDIWVDSVAPVISLLSPGGLCGSFQQNNATFTSDVAITSDTSNVVLTVTNGASTDTHMNPNVAGGVATFTAVAFDQGQNNLAATATDLAGNATTLTPAPCTVTVGGAPVVVFTTPTMTNMLCPAGSVVANCIADNDAGTAGWQGSITVHVTASGVPVGSSTVTFTIGATMLGTAMLDVNGNATLPITTNLVPEGPAITFTATTDNVPAHGVGVGTVTVKVATQPPSPPTNLAAGILARRKTTFQLSWNAPMDSSGGSVAGYQVRYAKVPITAGNFDDATMTTAITYAGTPAAPGVLDGVATPTLYIENGYYFAVAAVDLVGTRSSITATPASLTAHFNVTTIPSPAGVNERFGFAVSGDGDVNGDGLADIVVGTAGVGRAYLFLGKNNFAASAPAVTFTGATTGFGFRAVQIGDIDKDGTQDIAISDPQVGHQVYIYKGRTTWPATLTDAQADYVISSDASYAGSLFGFSLARLGDFTGDGIDDFAIGARSYGGGVGRVIIIPGQMGFTGVALPDLTHAITIDGDATLGTSAFGYKVLGMGHFYNTTSGTTLVVSAPSGTLSNPSAVGHVYAFHGQTGTAGVIAIAAADHFISGAVANAKIGTVLADLGTMFNGFAGVGIGNSLDTGEVAGANGTAYLTFGTPMSGPFSSQQVAYLTGATQTGSILIGGGISGRDISLSLIGDATPDVVFSGGAVGGTLAIADGATLASKGSPVDLAAKAEVQAPLPAGWGSGEAAGTLVSDINGDGVPDFCIGSVTNPGTILIYW